LKNLLNELEQIINDDEKKEIEQAMKVLIEEPKPTWLPSWVSSYVPSSLPSLRTPSFTAVSAGFVVESAYLFAQSQFVKKVFRLVQSLIYPFDEKATMQKAFQLYSKENARWDPVKPNPY
jgi:hypothetical protein